MKSLGLLFCLLCSINSLHGLKSGMGPIITEQLEDRVVVITMATGGGGMVAVPQTFPCSFQSSSPPTVTWYRNSSVVTTDSSHVIHPNGSLTITALLDGVDVTVEGLFYFCVVSNEYGSVMSSTARVQLAAFGSDWDSVSASPTDVEVLLESFVLLPCNPPSANPPPNIEWLRNDGSVIDPTSDITKYKLLASGDLIIGNIDIDDINAGPYRCRVTNRLIFEDINSPFQYTLVRVDEYSNNLTVFDTLQTNNMVEIGTRAEFTCLANANIEDSRVIEYGFLGGNPANPDDISRPDASFRVTSVERYTTMVILPVTQQVAGAYTCTITSLLEEDGSAISLSVIMFNIDVFARPNITSSPDQAMIAYIGDSVTFTCAVDGLPAPMLTYYVNASVVDAAKVSGGVLMLGEVISTDTGVYQCFAASVYGVVSRTWTLVVRETAPPVLVNRSDSQGTVAPTRTLHLWSIVSADPEPTIVWSLNGTAINTTNTAKYVVTNMPFNASACPIQYQYSLQVLNFSSSDSGNYIATITNQAATLMLTYQHYLELPVDIISLQAVGENCLIRGENTEITCNFIGTPTPTFTWMYDSMTITDGSEYTINGNVLTVNNVDQSDDGTYQCMGTNTVDGVQTMDMAAINFRICTFPAITAISATGPRELEEGDSLELRCGGTGDPEPDAMWRRYSNGQLVTISDADSPRIQVKAVPTSGELNLVFDEVLPGDAGVYSCLLLNIAGSVERNVSLTVRPASGDDDSDDFPVWAIAVVAVAAVLILVLIIVIIACLCYRSKSGAYGMHNGGAQGDDDETDQTFNPQYESLPAPRPDRPPEYKPTPNYPGGVRTPGPFSGSMIEMQTQQMSNTDLSRGQMYNYNSTSALAKQDMIDGVPPHQPRYDDFLSVDGQLV